MTGARPAAREVVAVGIDVGGTKTSIGSVDLASGAMLDIRSFASEAHRGAEPLHTALAHALHELLGPGTHQVPVGVAVPELVAPSGAVMTDVVVAGLAGDLRKRWADLGVCAVESDVRAAALAEATFGDGRTLASFVYVSVGTGVSSCLVLGGVPWAGVNGSAILIGSGVVVDEGTADPGPMPSVESVAAGPGIVADYLRRGGSAAGAREVLERVDHDTQARAAVETAGRTLGAALAELVNLLDPAAIIVGGGLGSAGGIYWDAAVGAARASIWADGSRSVPLLRSSLGPHAAVIGAALVGSRTSG